MPLYDEDSNPVEGALTPEEAKTLQDKMAELEEKAKKTDELSKSLEEKEKELSKLGTKDFNFQKLREKSEEELETFKSKMSEKEKLMLTEIMDLRKERDEESEKAFTEAKEEILSALAGSDAELRKKIEEAEKELTGEALTANELEQRYRKAYILAKAEVPRANPVFSGYTASYKDPTTKVKNFTDSESGKESVTKWFPDLVSKIYKDKK